MPAANSSAIEGVATKPLSSRGRAPSAANGSSAAPATTRGRKAPVNALPPTTDGHSPDAVLSPEPDTVPAKVGRGRPKGAQNKTPSTPRAPREPKQASAGGFNTRDIEVSVRGKIREATMAKRTLSAEFKAKDRELTAAMNAAVKAQSAAQTAYDKAAAELDMQVKQGNDLLAKLAG